MSTNLPPPFARPARAAPCGAARARFAHAPAFTLTGVAGALCGCEGVQSALVARGADASWILELSIIMFVGGAIIFALVMALIVLAIARRPPWLADRRVILWGGIAFPVVTLSALLVYGFAIARGVTDTREPAALKVEVIGEQYWWRVRYVVPGTGETVTSANEIRLPADRPVDLELSTHDVIHSFWVPSLAGKLDMVPGAVNRLRLDGSRPGVYRGQCAEYCGTQHAQMAFYVRVEEPADFERWLRAEAGDAVGAAEAGVADADIERGRALFLAADCGDCHAIRGTRAVGETGPDLTHIGSRLSIGAGMYPNNVGTLAGWIAGNQHLKPGNAMPNYRAFTGEELRLLARYLASLE